MHGYHTSIFCGAPYAWTQGVFGAFYWTRTTIRWVTVLIIPRRISMRRIRSIRTGSYPQIIHTSSKAVTGGVITCEEFVDVNGNWIPAIKLK